MTSTLATLFDQSQSSASSIFDQSENDNVTTNATELFKKSEAASCAADLHNQCHCFQFVLNTIAIGLLCLLGFAGNTVSIVVLQKDRNNRVAVFLLQSLAMADNSLLVISFVALSLVYGLLPVFDDGCYVRKYVVPPVQRYINPLGSTAQCCVIWMTVLLSLNRYVAVCKPFTAKRWLTMAGARLQVLVVFTLSVLLNLPRFFNEPSLKYCSPNPPCITNSLDHNDHTSYSNTSSYNEATTTTSYEYSTFYESTTRTPFTDHLFSVTLNHPSGKLQKGGSLKACCTDEALRKNFYYDTIYLNYFYTSVMLILPLVLMIGISIPLVRRIQESKRRMIENSLSYRGQQENNITIVMVVVVIVMIVCHMPDRVMLVLRVLYFTDSADIACPRGIYYVFNFANLLVMTNSSTDFLVYYIFRKRFRTILWEKLRCGRMASRDNSENRRGFEADGALGAEIGHNGVATDRKAGSAKSVRNGEGSGKLRGNVVEADVCAPLVAFDNGGCVDGLMHRNGSGGGQSNGRNSIKHDDVIAVL